MLQVAWIFELLVSDESKAKKQHCQPERVMRVTLARSHTKLECEPSFAAHFVGDCACPLHVITKTPESKRASTARQSHLVASKRARLVKDGHPDRRTPTVELPHPLVHHRGWADKHHGTHPFKAMLQEKRGN